jgi:hypothetical protein
MVEPELRPWLITQVYGPRRQRTRDLVVQSVNALVAEQQRVSLAAVAARSKLLDPTGRGISVSAILTNPEARAYYEQHRSWVRHRDGGRAAPVRSEEERNLREIQAGRDLARVRTRYRRWSKAALVERLIAVEQAYAGERETWLAAQDELLISQLRAEAAEARLQTTQARGAPRDQTGDAGGD